MKKYRIVQNLDSWLGNQIPDEGNTIITEKELLDLARSWGKEVDDLLEDLEDVDEEESAMKVSMETAKALQKMKRTASNYSPVIYDGKEYIQIADMDTLSYDGRYGESYWEGLAVRLGDDITDGSAPVYTLIWFLDNPDAEDGSDTVDDWDKVDDVKEVGSIDIFDGLIS